MGPVFFFFLWLWYNEDILRYRVVFLFHVCVCVFFLGCRYSGDTMVNIRFYCSMMFRVFSSAVCVFFGGVLHVP